MDQKNRERLERIRESAESGENILGDSVSLQGITGMFAATTIFRSFMEVATAEEAPDGTPIPEHVREEARSFIRRHLSMDMIFSDAEDDAAMEMMREAAIAAHEFANRMMISAAMDLEPEIMAMAMGEMPIPWDTGNDILH